MPDLPIAAANAAVLGILLPDTEYLMSLHTAAPLGTGVDEVVGDGYVRQSIYFSGPVDGVLTSIDQQAFADMPAESAIPYFGLWTVSGTYCGGGELLSSLDVPALGVIGFPVGAITATIS